MPKSESTPSLKPIREPDALSSEYHKARKQLMLWAGILFIWELVGIDLEKAKEAGGNAGAIIGAIKSPQAVPWALLILVGYFLFKTTIEWYQCNLSRRRLRVSRIDFTSALIVSLVAYVLYIGQAASRVQFADVVQTSDKFNSTFLGFFIGMGIAMTAILALRWHLTLRTMPRWAISGTIVMAMASVTQAISFRHSLSVRFTVYGAALGISLLTTALLRRQKRLGELE